jgi:hypothetical protein
VQTISLNFRRQTVTKDFIRTLLTEQLPTIGWIAGSIAVIVGAWVAIKNSVNSENAKYWDSLHRELRVHRLALKEAYREIHILRHQNLVLRAKLMEHHITVSQEELEPDYIPSDLLNELDRIGKETESAFGDK